MKQNQKTSKRCGIGRGHILTVVLIFSFVITLTVLTAFTVLYRYADSAKLSLEQTREEILYKTPTDVHTEQSSGVENAGN